MENMGRTDKELQEAVSGTMVEDMQDVVTGTMVDDKAEEEEEDTINSTTWHNNVFMWSTH